MEHRTLSLEMLDEGSRTFYRDVLERLANCGLPFLVGGAYALTAYTGITRHTKDLDLFIYPADEDRALEILAAGGYEPEHTNPIWLAKARQGENFVDLIFGSGNGVIPIDSRWFDHAGQVEILGIPVKLCPAEEMIWMKAFILKRDRYDGADIAHILRARGHLIDWQRLLLRFGAHWKVLLSHLVLFTFIYPSEQEQIPRWVLDELLDRLLAERGEARPVDKLCRGTLLDPVQFRIDVEEWGYEDARPPGAIAAGQP